jgi:hypothetical protein
MGDIILVIKLRRTIWVGHVAYMGEMYTEFQFEKLGDTGIDEVSHHVTILKWILEKSSGRMWTRLS